MGDDDKPFACNMTGCTMTFANEDHLTVHKKKHEMSLSLNSPSILKDNYVDQTPTPTKLLRNCLEVGLFQDLGLHPNPFDEQFRKATQSGTPTASSSSTCVLDQDSLNTPSVPLLTSDVNLPVPSADILETSCNIPRPSYILPDPEPEGVEETMPFDPSTNSCEPVIVSPDVVEDYDLVEAESQTVPAVIVKTAKAATLVPQPNTRSAATPRRVVQTPVITSVASMKPKMAAPTKQQIVFVSRSVASTTSSQPVITLTAPATQTAKVIQPAPTASSSVVSTTTSSTPMIQLIVKLDGQSMPFNIPLPSMTTVPAPTSVVTNPNTVTVQPSRIITASARDALKGTMEAKMSRKGAPTVVNAISSSSGQVLGSKLPTTIGSLNPNNPIATVQPTVRNTYNTGKRRDPDDADDPQEKRRKFLERNRAAATRCRLKKKKWVDDLENKCRELTAQNLQLQKEVSNLRNEVAHLKTLLLAHKDCPITQQQMKTNGQPQVYSLSTLTSVCASSGSSPSVTSFRTVDSNSSPVLLETIHLEGSEGSMDNSNDDSVPGSTEY